MLQTCLNWFTSQFKSFWNKGWINSRQCISFMNWFSNQFEYDLSQDFHQELLTFIDIHTWINSQIDSKVENWYMDWFMNWLKNYSLVKFSLLMPQLCKGSSFILNITWLVKNKQFLELSIAFYKSQTLKLPKTNFKWLH